MEACNRAARPALCLEASVLRWHCFLQKLSLQVGAVSLVHGSTLDDCAMLLERMRKELEHLEHAVHRYLERHGEELEADLAAALTATDLPQSHLEAIVAQLVLAIASQLALRRRIEQEGCVRPLERQLVDQREHVEAARAALRDALCGDRALYGHIPHLVSRWLGVAFSHLDKRLRKEYLADVAHVMDAVFA